MVTEKYLSIKWLGGKTQLPRTEFSDRPVQPSDDVIQLAAPFQLGENSDERRREWAVLCGELDHGEVDGDSVRDAVVGGVSYGHSASSGCGGRIDIAKVYGHSARSLTWRCQGPPET